MTTHRIYYDGTVHVQHHMCASCIGRPGNLMHLEPGRRDGMVADVLRDESCIPCHKTLGLPAQARSWTPPPTHHGRTRMPDTEECMHLLDPATCTVCNGRDKREQQARHVMDSTYPASVVAARFDGTCALCRLAVYVDDPIVATDAGWAHQECAS